MRLIDADKLLKKAITVENVNATGRTKTMVDTNDIDTAPTVDANPVVHAHWELIDNDIDTFVYRCSNCKDTIALPFGMIKEFKGCPYCLSRMDEEQ